MTQPRASPWTRRSSRQGVANTAADCSFSRNPYQRARPQHNRGFSGLVCICLRELEEAGHTAMIIVRLIGGLGNQMFQYALGRSLSAAQDVCLRLDVSGFESYR